MFIERRLEHSNGDQMFESRLPMQNYSYSSHYQQSPISQTSSFNFDSGLKQSPNLRALHTDDDAILTSSWEQQQQFHQPNTRKVTKIIPSMLCNQIQTYNFCSSFVQIRRKLFNIEQSTHTTT